MRIVKILFFGILFFEQFVFAQGVSYNQEFQVNTYFESIQEHPVVTKLYSDKFLISWWSLDQDGSQYGVYGQLFNHDISKFANEFRVNSHTELNQHGQNAISFLDGNFIVTWNSRDQDGNEYGIYSQLFSNEGTKIGPENQVNTFIDGSQYQPDIALIQDERYVICWTSSIQDNETAGIYAQKFNNDGTKYGSEFRVNEITYGRQYFSSVSTLQDGGFVVCWSSEIENSDETEIYCSIFDQEGNKTTSDIPVTLNTQYYPERPKVMGLKTGGFVVCWVNWYQDGSDQGVFAQIFNNDGAKQGKEFRVNTNTHWLQKEPAMTELPDLGLVFVWNSNHTGYTDWRVYGQIFDYNGSKIGWEFQINDDLSGTCRYPSVSYLNDNLFLVAWGSFDDGDGWGIFAKYYDYKFQNPLNPFSLNKPQYDEISYSTRQQFSWTSTSLLKLNFPWEIEYTLFLDENENFSSPTIIDSIYDTTYTVQNLTPGTTYFWKVLAKNITGDSLWSSETFGFFVDYDATAIEEIPNNKIQNFQPHSNYPNPFNPATTIMYELPEQSSVNLAVYDISGRLLQTLVNEKQTAGSHKAVFDAAGLSSGVYFYTIKAGQYRETKKMLLVR